MILHPVARPIRPHDQAATDAWLADKPDVATVLCENATDYPAAVLTAWDRSGDLVIIEHDIVPRAETLIEFDACRQPFCTSPYRLSGGAVSLLSATTGLSLGGDPADYAGMILRCHSGLGCVRLRNLRSAVDPSTFAGVYDGLDRRVSAALLAAGSSFAWHVHPPVAAHTGRP